MDWKPAHPRSAMRVLEDLIAEMRGSHQVSCGTGVFSPLFVGSAWCAPSVSCRKPRRLLRIDADYGDLVQKIEEVGGIGGIGTGPQGSNCVPKIAW